MRIQQLFIILAALRYGSSYLLLGPVRHSSPVEHGLSSTTPHARINHLSSLLEQTRKSLHHNAPPLINTCGSTISHQQAVIAQLTLLVLLVLLTCHTARYRLLSSQPRTRASLTASKSTLCIDTSPTISLLHLSWPVYQTLEARVPQKKA